MEMEAIMRKRTDPYMPIEQRFFSHVQKTESCWLWTARCRNGYGQFRIGSRVRGDRKMVAAHRWYWELLNGPVPDGLEPDHLCRNRSCVRPDHLEPVTRQVNILRSPLARFNGSRYQSAKVHCPYGHAYDEINTRIDKHGSKHCRRCRHLRNNKWRQS